ncbi:hypothetical protein GS415_03245 [Rhodococcus hoagii]|nr:hypothetical protein [Prescottella equi]
MGAVEMDRGWHLRFERIRAAVDRRRCARRLPVPVGGRAHRVGEAGVSAFAHEPNGTWYPWSVAAGTSRRCLRRGLAARARPVRDPARAHNVKWVWSPNVSFPGSSSTGATYPGDDYVDVVGVDGYNWGTSQPWSHWIAPTDLFVPTMDELRRIAPGNRNS